MIITKDIQKVTDEIVKKINSLLKKKDYVVLGFPGGRSVKLLNDSLKKEKRIDWKKTHIFMVDERLVPINDAESNYRLLEETLLNGMEIPKSNLHPFILSEEKDHGLKKYESEFKKYGGKFDIAIFGVGEDGHIGALFPSGSIYDDSEHFFLLHDSPKPPKDRMTLSRKLALKTGLGIFLFVGDGKKHAFKKFSEKNIKIEEMPAKIAYDIKDAVIYENLR